MDDVKIKFTVVSYCYEAFLNVSFERREYK
jgi:hypothetical protein